MLVGLAQAARARDVCPENIKMALVLMRVLIVLLGKVLILPVHRRKKNAVNVQVVGRM